VSGRPASRRGAAVALAAIAGVVLCALVVIAATANPLHAPTHEGTTASIAFGDALFVVGVVAAVAGAGVLIVSIASLRGGPRLDSPRRRRSILPILLAILVALSLRSLIDRPPPTRDPAAPAEGSASGSEAPTSSQVWRDAGWVLVALLGVAALGAVVVLRRYRHEPTPAMSAASARDVPDAVTDAVDAALDSLDTEGDARQGIIAAYARMLHALEQRGLGCRPSETPRVHLARCLAAAEVRPEPIERLVELFEEARFSTHPMTWEHRDAARRALGAVRDDLVVAGAG
jgi:hypothetical protein